MTHVQLESAIKEYIQAGVDDYDDALFNRLALETFRFQWENNPVYRQYCAEQGLVSPETIARWDEIPPLPSAQFKQEAVTSFPKEQAQHFIKTGGTTDPARRGMIYRNEQAFELVLAANRMMTKSFLFPDVERMKILLLVPSPEIAPAMGMAVGLAEVRKHFGTPASRFLISEKGLDIAGFYADLRQAEETGEPLAIIGATAGFIFFFKYCQRRRWRFNLPPGSRVCDGGGYMGLFGHCTRDEYYQLVQKYFNVPPEYCVNTYGMGESNTNYFDNVLRDKLVKKSSAERSKISPPWARTVVIDQETGRRLPAGQTGVICHYDLANFWHAFAVRTEDLGYQIDPLKFEIVGRVSGRRERPPGHPAWVPLGTEGFGRMKEMVLNLFVKGLGEAGGTGRFANDGDSCAVVAEEFLLGQARHDEK